MTMNEQHEQIIHLLRLGRDLRALGVTVSMRYPSGAQPVLEVLRDRGRRRVGITVSRRMDGAAFTWRRTWGRSVRVPVDADNAAAIVAAAVTA
jgi:hypothetical protein